MALNINGRMKVKTLRTDFKKEFGLALRVYDGRSFADDNATLASIRKGDSKGGEFSPKRNTKVGNLEDKILDMFGIKTQVAGSDDSYLCDNDHTLAKALEADEKLMVKREKRSDNADDIVEKDVPSEVASESGELTEEEKKWLDDLWSLDEAPESIRSSKRFMLEAVKKDGRSLKYASYELRNDKEIVIASVSEAGEALEFSNESLQDDKDVVLAAINNDGSSLKYASDRFKEDLEIVLKAVENDENAIENLRVGLPDDLFDKKENELLRKIVSLYINYLKSMYEDYLDFLDAVDEKEIEVKMDPQEYIDLFWNEVPEE